MNVFLLEGQAVVRAHVTALGVNALLSHQVNDCVLLEHLNRNQVSTKTLSTACGKRERKRGREREGEREKESKGEREWIEQRAGGCCFVFAVNFALPGMQIFF